MKGHYDFGSTILRDENDFYSTDPLVIKALLDSVKDEPKIKLKNTTVWENACGDGILVDELINSGIFYSIIGSDIVDRGYENCSIVNFLRQPFFFKTKYDIDIDWIITNPPYKYAEEWLKKSYNVARKGVILLLKTIWVASNKRYVLFNINNYKPNFIYQFPSRINIYKGGPETLGLKYGDNVGNPMDYAWFIWLKNDIPNDTVFRWIKPSINYQNI